ncbi:uncharacterized protein LOC116422641 [Sarcophilus harrisii]|uniref:uncharacterized protein LOC116422641 n=1 Tax=Sarcophilus harrisii TaxID=9305 RepID=UPI001301B5F8|nr:uncharacterized protein LOC116422641 [Sarcophilus harrisii]
MEPEGSRELIFPPLTEPVDAPVPNLTPRHQELIPTPCGPSSFGYQMRDCQGLSMVSGHRRCSINAYSYLPPLPPLPLSVLVGGRGKGNGLNFQIKPWSELSCPVKVYFCITLVSLLSIIGLTIKTLVQKSDENFTVSLIQLIGVVFCIYYVTRGILQENRQELIVFILSILLVMFRSLVNFLVLAAHGDPSREAEPPLQARFVVILLVGFFDVICAVILIRTQGMMAFRVGGALESLQAQYFMLNLCFSMLTFDLQAQLCLCVLILTSGLYASLQHSLILVVGVLWAGLKVTIGILAILRELKVLVWIFLVQNVPEVAYLFYLLYTQSLGPGQLVHWRSGGHCGLVHLCGHQVCLALGPGPRVSKLRPGPERENVFFLWKDRVLSSPQTPQGPRAGQTPPPASAARSQQPSSEEPHRCLPCMWQ